MGAENFRVIARALILTADRQVVLITSQTGTALVTPGGAVDAGETLPQAAARETQEECGLAVTIGPAIWLREFYDRKHAQANLEVYFLAHLAAGVTLVERWEHADADRPDLVRRAGLYTRQALQSIATPVYPVELRDAFWVGLENGFGQAYLGRFESPA